MKSEKINPRHVRAALRLEERNLKDLLDAIELNDISPEAIFRARGNLLFKQPP